MDWIQDWCGTAAGGRVMFDWQRDACAYPDWWGMVDEFFTLYGIRTLSYFNPFLTTSSVNKGCEKAKERPSMYDYAKKQDGF